MNRLILRKMALSTLLLSTAATPVFADADNSSGSSQPRVQTAAVTLTAAAAPVQGSILVAARIPDLLGLVRSYAPETLPVWTDILSKYDAATPVTIMNPDSLHPADTLTVSGEVTASVVPVSVPIAWTAALSSAAGNLAAVPVELNDKIQVVEVDGIIPVSIAETVAASPAGLTAFTTSASTTTAAGGLSGPVTAMATAALLPLAENNAFVQAQAALTDAAESKDAAAIKQALAGLLKQYQELTAKLEAAE